MAQVVVRAWAKEMLTEEVQLPEVVDHAGVEVPAEASVEAEAEAEVVEPEQQAQEEEPMSGSDV